MGVAFDGNQPALADDATAAHGDRAGRQRLDRARLVRGDQHGGPVPGRFGDQLVEDRPGGAVEPGVRLVEQPELGPARGQHRDRHPPPLAGRELRRPGPEQSAGEAQSLARGVDPVDGSPPAARTAKRTFSRTVRSS